MLCLATIRLNERLQLKQLLACNSFTRPESVPALPSFVIKKGTKNIEDVTENLNSTKLKVDRWLSSNLPTQNLRHLRSRALSLLITRLSPFSCFGSS